MSSPAPPLVYRVLLRLASFLCPAPLRTAWRKQWQSGLHDWWILAERGELTNEAAALAARYCRGAWADALELRFRRDQILHALRGPWCPIFAALLIIGSTGVLSRGFQVIRRVADLVLNARPLPVTLRPHIHYDPRGDVVAAYLAPLALAVLIAVMLLVFNRLPVPQSGWRYWTHLLLKTMSIQTALTVLWFEGGSTLRSVLRPEALRVLGGGLVLAIVFVAGFGAATRWCITDQRRRCPVCLRLLDMPVSVGSWGSVFEPATTELLCAGGHGSLSLSERDNTGPDRWTTLDASWRELFDTAAPFQSD
ncbi:hypothetical protein [uncultured Paludibaculum sp.]|uniref:hypothetical protein n=1 Tax=uncultured Paludibaculum sp. TaxID=1765020 RepID=UPI002AAB59F9|nr:hypothetical protein [uncultured Paludibaculum sp.]